MAARIITETQRLLLETMVELGGGRFRGIQQGFYAKDNRWVEALAFFNSPKTGTTLALPVSKVSAEAVRVRIAESNIEFEKAAA